jgi:hypothetical protein
VAGGGVILSLLFVGLELRQNNSLARAEAYRTTAAEYASLATAVATDERLNHLLGKVMWEGAGIRDFPEADDRQRLGSVLTAWVKLNEAVFYQVRETVLDSTSYSLLGATIGGSRYVRESWPGIRQEVSPEFARFFERRFEIPPPPVDSLP